MLQKQAAVKATAAEQAAEVARKAKAEATQKLAAVESKKGSEEKTTGKGAAQAKMNVPDPAAIQKVLVWALQLGPKDDQVKSLKQHFAALANPENRVPCPQLAINVLKHAYNSYNQFFLFFKQLC